MNSYEQKIDALTSSLLNDYSNGRVIDDLKPGGRADRGIVIGVLEKLRTLIFPGYFSGRERSTYTVKNNTAMLLEEIISELSGQIALVLPCGKDFALKDCGCLEEEAERLTFAFLEKIPMIREYIETDVQAAYDGDPAAFSKDEIIFSYPGLGSTMYAAVTAADYPLISATTLIITIMVLIVTLLLDIIYGFIDPRVKAAQFDA